MKIIDIRQANFDGKIEAFLKIETQEGFTISGFKIIKGDKGRFVGWPSQKNDKTGDYFKTVGMEDKNDYFAMSDEIKNQYLQMLDTNGAAPSPSARKDSYKIKQQAEQKGMERSDSNMDWDDF